MVWRHAELTELTAALGEARRGRATAVVIGGEAGVGKTRLVEEFIADAREAGTIVLRSGCVDFGDEGPPFWPFIDAVRGLRRGPHSGAVDDVLGLPGAALTAGGADVTAIYQPLSDASADGPRLFRLALEALTELAVRSPVVLVIEDVHWADRSTRDLLRFLFANLVHDPVLCIVTYRDDALVRGHPLQPLLVELRRNRRVQFIDLKPFTRTELAGLLSDLLDAPADDELVNLIWSRSGGNPFFAEELLASVQAGAGQQLPPSLSQVLSSRVEVLSDDAQELLRLLATGGEAVGHELLVALSDLAPPRLLAALRECADHRIVVVDEQQRYCFRHALLAEVVYEEMLPGERRHFHASYADVLSRATENDAVALARIAHHVYAAGDTEQALCAAVAAAHAADAVHGFAEAHHHYQRAIELWDLVPDAAALTGTDQLALVERAARAANLAGEHRQAAALLAAVVRESESDARAALLRQQLGRYLWAAGDSRRALEAFEAAVNLAPASDRTAERARVIGAYAEALMLAGRYRRSRAQAEEALAIAEEAGAEAVQAQVLATLGFDLAYLGDPDAGTAALERARDIAVAEGTPEDVARAYVNLAEVLSGPLGRFDAAVAVATEGAARASELGLARTYGVALQAIAVNTLFRAGQWAAADDLLADAFARAPAGAAAIDLNLAAARMSVGRGDFARAAEQLATAERMVPGELGPRYEAALLTLRAGLALWEGRPDRARAAVTAGLAACASASDDVWLLAPILWHGLHTEADRAESARQRRADPELAEARGIGSGLLAQARNLFAQPMEAAPAVRDAVEAYLHLCEGEWSRAEARSDPAHWNRAAECWRERGQPYPVAYALYRQAEALLNERSQSAEAPGLLRAANAIAEQLGAEPLRREITALATRARIAVDAQPAPEVDLREEAPTAVAGLTRREVDVLMLVAEGRSNREIAEHLFISEKTASVHVSHILAKLGVRTRVQASAVAHQLGVAGQAPA
ncbi:MAG TPA: AAA family ATPase [Acidimicrobiales bacterium]|nr:AAA family ATPase [Acidimicrobiales bacterium]